jgi:hypothetical protein
VSFTFATREYPGAAVSLGTNHLTVLTADGKTALEIDIDSKGVLTVRGVDAFKLGDKWYGHRLVVHPVVSNTIKVTNALYDDQ